MLQLTTYNSSIRTDIRIKQPTSEEQDFLQQIQCPHPAYSWVCVPYSHCVQWQCKFLGYTLCCCSQHFLCSCMQPPYLLYCTEDSIERVKPNGGQPTTHVPGLTKEVPSVDYHVGYIYMFYEPFSSNFTHFLFRVVWINCSTPEMMLVVQMMEYMRLC